MVLLAKLPKSVYSMRKCKKYIMRINTNINSNKLQFTLINDNLFYCKFFIKVVEFFHGSQKN